MIAMLYPRAHSKMVLRIHGMDEVGVRSSVGPPFRNLTAVSAVIFYRKSIKILENLQDIDKLIDELI